MQLQALLSNVCSPVQFTIQADPQILNFLFVAVSFMLTSRMTPVLWVSGENFNLKLLSLTCHNSIKISKLFKWFGGSCDANAGKVLKAKMTGIGGKCVLLDLGISAVTRICRVS